MAKEIKDPKHYCGDGHITARVAMRSMFTNAKQKPMVIFWWGNAFKYLWRWHLKNGVEDLDKCSDCIEKMKEELGAHHEHRSEELVVNPILVIDARDSSFIVCPYCGSTIPVCKEYRPKYCSECGCKFGFMHIDDHRGDNELHI